jgi:hypothetical protein
VIRSPLANLDTTPPTPGLVAVVSVLFGSTAFDAFRESTRWVSFIQDTGRSTYVQNGLGLLGFCLLVGLVLVLGCWAMGIGSGLRRRDLPPQFAFSMVPIIIGYVVAHYLSYVVEVGTQTLIQASDPLSDGSDVLGTGGWSVPYWLAYHPTLLANVKVLSVVVGHVVGVVAAHERALQVLPERTRVTGQIPLLVAMVAFTVGGLYLLFAS